MENKKSLILKLSNFLNKLPNIGPRQAKRLAYFLARLSPDSLEEVAKLFWEMAKDIAICEECFCVFEKDNKDQKICSICSNVARKNKFICVVEKDTDIISIEKTGKYKGVYYVLGGLLNSFEDNVDEKVRISGLAKKVKNLAKTKEPVEEIVLALNLTAEGYLTIGEIKKELQGLNVKITQLGVGLPIGSEVEFADTETLIESFKNRG